MNDGGKEVSDKRRRMELFWDYLDVPQDSPLRRRDGMFSSTVIGSGSRKVKVIAMDTRTHRDRHIIPGVRFASTLTNSVTRLFAVATGLNRLQSGTVLGEAQWQWLEAQLQHSKEEQISVNIIISSIQIFTPNPMVESWMHVSYSVIIYREKSLSCACTDSITLSFVAIIAQTLFDILRKSVGNDV